MTKAIQCPLCENKKYIVHTHYKIKELAESWKNTYGFDPFHGHELGESITKMQCVECSLIYYNPLFLGDSDFYAKLSKNYWYYEEEKWEFDEAIKLLLEHAPKSLLEIGCGNGNFLRKVNHAVDNVQGIEINMDAIEKCKAADIRVSSTPLIEVKEEFDMVVLFEVLEHLDNFKETLDQMIRITKKGGMLIIAVPNPEGYLKEQGTLLLDMPPHHSCGWSLKTFEYLGKKYNLEKVHYGLEPLRDVHHRGIHSAQHQDPEPVLYANSSMKGRFLNKVRTLVADSFQPLIKPVLNRLDYLTYKLEKEKIIGQTHLIAFKKN
jgi:2-polyprenyl-3-methyl-5-hydroxy-6-metoxy-1,4-benzoquinol methylase